jgi:hypothetical protein
VDALVIYESLTGNTGRAAELLGTELDRAGAAAAVCPATRVDYQALARADLVVVGTWTDGIVVAGQRPGGASRLRRLPVMDGKRCVVFCTYAIDPGRTLHKFTRLMQERGADVLGGRASRRTRISREVPALAERLMDATGG